MESLSERLYRYLNNHQGEWFNGATLGELAHNVGYKPDTASRRLRELHEEGRIEREERKGRRAKSVWYQVKITI